MTQPEETQVEVKKEPGIEETDDDMLKQKLVAQIEYYFGDVNLPRDRFIKEECSKNDGWFPVGNLLKFNRVANMLRSVPKDDRVKMICEALKPSELVDVNDGELKIRRSPDCPLPERDSEERTIYLKGFNKLETTLDDLLDFFKNKYEGVESVIMRYYKEKTIKTEAEIKKEQEVKAEVKEENGAAVKKEESEGEKMDVKEENGAAASEKKEEKVEPKLVWVRKFKGSIFVVFKTVEQAKKLLDDPSIDYKGMNVQLKMWQADYKALKTKEYQEKLASRKKKGGGGGGKAAKADDDDEKEEEVKEEIPKGALVKLLDVPEGFTREIIKEKWFSVLDKDKFAIAFIDFNKGDKNAVLRLEREGAGNEALELIKDKKLIMKEGVDGAEPVTSAMEGFEGEEEAKYVEEIKKQRLTMKNKKRNFGGRGGGRGDAEEDGLY